jgi:pimeloyl-ACP methyl ester carboxylesterase
MHGKAFGGYYFEHVVEALSAAGYRVVVPDQIGWGKSPKADIHYSFHRLAPTQQLCWITSTSGKWRSWATRPAA